MCYFLNRPVFHWLYILCFLYCISGCAPLQIKGSVFSPSHNRYTVNIPESGWEPIREDKEDIALWHKQYHAMIVFLSSDIESKHFSQEMLNSHLFIGIKNKHTLLEETVFVDNQQAMHTIQECIMDNHKLKIESYVIKAGDKVYDLVCWSPLDSFSCIQNDFENMLKTFQFTKD